MTSAEVALTVVTIVSGPLLGWLAFEVYEWLEAWYKKKYLPPRHCMFDDYPHKADTMG